MNEMISRTFNGGDTYMKKTLIIVALAAVLVLALGAAPAFAKYAGYSSSTQYVPWAEAESLASLNPDAATQAFGPHAGYATTTIKCAVCHSVHRGDNVILNKGTNGCSYCHTTAFWGGGAVATTISWEAGTPAADSGPHQSCASSYCHGGPHGVGASTYAGPASKLLTNRADTELGQLVAANLAADAGFTADLATYDATTRVLATGAVCGRSGCHDNSMFGVVSAGASAPVDADNDNLDSAGDWTVTGHRVIAAATSDWNATGDYDPATYTGTIAYAPVDYCNSCHDLSDDNNGGKAAFPHALYGVVDTAVGADGTWRPAVWLTAGADASSPRFAVGPYNQYTRVDRNTDGDYADAGEAAGSSILDGICLKCHADTATGLGTLY